MLTIHIIGVELLFMTIIVAHGGVMVLLIVISFIAMIFVDSWFILVALICWPILIILMMIINIMFDGIRLLSATNCVYMALSVIFAPTIVLLYLIILVIVSYVMVNLLGAYVGYWLICVSMLGVSISVYCLFDSNLVWLGLLPLVFFFMNQNLVISLFMLKVLWLF